MPRPHGFSWTDRSDSTVTISHHGRPVTTLRGARAEQFRTEVTTSDPQLVMARWTGNYRRGNERTARNHPRNKH
ncbi:hypothetical protein [Streptomyces cavernae]|uniref:hypothetical protein n=1 Tax=Streptomyces cavernae TaxID=2259034 RepID=UPI000FEBDCDC|nr:hypothetical protein [Streptomyces cavernae]